MESIKEDIIVRRAEKRDISGIMNVACSQGRINKDYRAGFLMDDYVSDYDYFNERFLALIDKLHYFYVIENGTVLGFLIAYDKEEWLIRNQNWFDDIVWNPEFDRKLTDSFILVDKTAILSGITGKGLGSRLYDALIKDMKSDGINNMFAETIISPFPNFASLEFRVKQKYKLAGIRYEHYKDKLYTDLMYYKTV